MWGTQEMWGPGMCGAAHGNGMHGDLGPTDMGHVGWHRDVGHTGGDVGIWGVWGSVWGGTGTWVALVAPWGGTGMWGTQEMWGPGTCGAVCGVYGVMWGLRTWGNTWGGTGM